MVEAIRQHDRARLITVGLVTWTFPFDELYSHYPPRSVAALLDFMSLHVHISEVEALHHPLRYEMRLRALDFGKPILAEELSFMVSDEARERFLERMRGSVELASGRTVQPHTDQFLPVSK